MVAAAAVACLLVTDLLLPARLPTPHVCRSNRFVDILEEGIAEWARQQTMGTHAVNIDGGLHGGPHAGQHSDCEDDHSSERARKRGLRCIGMYPAMTATLELHVKHRGLCGFCAALAQLLAGQHAVCAALCLAEDSPHRLPPMPPPCPLLPPNSAHAGSAAHGHDSLQLPFELVALEAALKEVVNAAGMQVKELEALALPALDALTKSVSDERQAAWQTVCRAVWPAGLHPLSASLR